MSTRKAAIGFIFVTLLIDVIGPPMMTNLFAWSIRPGSPIYLPGAPFLLGSLLMLMSAIVAFISFKKHQKSGKLAVRS